MGGGGDPSQTGAVRDLFWGDRNLQNWTVVMVAELYTFIKKISKWCTYNG